MTFIWIIISFKKNVGVFEILKFDYLIFSFRRISNLKYLGDLGDFGDLGDLGGLRGLRGFRGT